MVAAGPLGRWAEANEASQGTERSAYVALLQLMLENMGSPTGREPYGDGALVVVRGRESRPHGEGGQVSNDRQHVEVREMRSAETCLAIIRTRGERELPIDDLYRQLFNPEFYLQAYGKIYSQSTER